MVEKSTVEVQVSKDAVDAAIRRDEIGHEDLFEHLDIIAEIYAYVNHHEEATREELKSMLEYRGFDIGYGISKYVQAMDSLKIVEDDRPDVIDRLE